MPTLRVPNCGSVGLVKDLSQHELPINAWTDARNMRFLNGYAWQFYGYGQVYDTPPVVPHHLLPVVVGTQRYWLYAGLAKVHGVTLSGGLAVHTNLTRQTAGNDVDYTAPPNAWTSTLLGGIPVLNNGVDPPQQWDLDITHRLQALANWPAATTCRALRGYKNFLVALGVTKSGASLPFMVKWSHPAAPGAVPSSWDETDTTKDAGEADLAEGYDPIVDGLQLRDSFVIYKEASVWRCDFGGGQGIFHFAKVLGTTGAMNRNCIVEIDGYHAVFAGYDCIVHDGQSARTVLDKVARRWLLQNIDVDNAGLCFVFKNPFFNEVCFCFPSIGSTSCDKAIVWNWSENTVSPRDLPGAFCGAAGPVDTGLVGIWSQDSAPWAADLTAWNGPDFVPSTARCLIGSAGPRLYMLDSSASFDGAPPAAFLERRGLAFDVPENVKLATAIRPRVTGNLGETINVRIGGQEDPWADPQWSEPLPFTIGSTVELDCLVPGRYLAIRFESGTAWQWRLDSYDIDVELMGRY